MGDDARRDAALADHHRKLMVHKVGCEADASLGLDTTVGLWIAANFVVLILILFVFMFWFFAGVGFLVRNGPGLCDALVLPYRNHTTPGCDHYSKCLGELQSQRFICSYMRTALEVVAMYIMDVKTMGLREPCFNTM